MQTFGTVESTLHTFEQNAVQQRRTELERAAQQIQEQLHTLGQQRIQEFTHTVQGQLEETHAHFSQTSSQLGQKAQSTVEQLLHEVGEFAQQQGQQHLHDQVEQLLQGVVSHLGEEIALSIAETEAGAAVTGAITPVMPELIAVYKATEAIKEAIRILKEIEGTLGSARHTLDGIGHAFGIS